MTDYSDNIKAQALAALIAGQSYTEVARAFGVPVGTLKSWKSRDTAGLDAGDATSATAKKERIGALLLDYLVSTLETLKAQQVVFADRTWLEKQSAMAARRAVGSRRSWSVWPGLFISARLSSGACFLPCAA
jgi:transposase-like protein